MQGPGAIFSLNAEEIICHTPGTVHDCSSHNIPLKYCLMWEGSVPLDANTALLYIVYIGQLCVCWAYDRETLMGAFCIIERFENVSEETWILLEYTDWKSTQLLWWVILTTALCLQKQIYSGFYDGTFFLPLLLEYKTQLMGKEKTFFKYLRSLRKIDLFFLLAGSESVLTMVLKNCLPDEHETWKTQNIMLFSPFFILPSCEAAVNSKISSRAHHHVLYSRCSRPYFSDCICSFYWSWLESRQGLYESSLLLYKASAVAQRDRKSCLLLIIGGERTLHWQAQSWARQLSSQVQKQ